MEGDLHDVIRSGAELFNIDTGGWLVPLDIDRPLVVLVHGFTSHGHYLQRLAAHVRGHGFLVTLFNYDSYLGIDTAAAALRERLRILQAAVSSRGYALVAHSMGGLVARYFARIVRPPLLDALRGIALLGTPNKGTLAGTQYISYMLDWSDYVSTVNPFARSRLCRSTVQMILGDEERLIESMNQADRARPVAISIMSLSGGLNTLELSRQQGGLSARLQNVALQALIREVPNDGLVSESSADIRHIIRSADHENGYSEYERTNHTNLVQNPGVADKVIQWLNDRVF